jgi:vacuolar-type H+-ATPase catalytic subunit A/Vma1
MATEIKENDVGYILRVSGPLVIAEGMSGMNFIGMYNE